MNVTTRPAPSRQVLRDAILDATNDLLGRYGYNKMTVEDIADEVGIGKGTIYLHFPSKEEVVLSTIDRMVDRLLVKLAEIAEGPGSVSSRLESMLIARILYRFDHRHHDSKSMDELLSALRSPYLARRERYFAAEAAVLAEVLEEGRAHHELSVDDVAVTAQTLVLATNALLPSNLSARELGKRKHVAEQATALARLLVRGLTLPRRS
ncbi:MAG TPA: TetR/AcrR family transcriptional regulator [Candidatus Eisenbacteria bacterium]|nr:TetR/AcrR family transcriptional regulator [Candidatus Eisenbacteria bacterium]